MSLDASELRIPIRFTTPVKQFGLVRRLYDTMKRPNELATAVVRPIVFAIIAGLLILVVLPAALGAQAGAIR